MVRSTARRHRISARVAAALIRTIARLCASLAIAGCAFVELPTSPYEAGDVAELEYPDSGPWASATAQPLNDLIANPRPLDADSESYVNRMASEFARPAGSSTDYKLVLVIEGGSVPIYYADPDSPRLSIPITTAGYGARGVTGVPIPAWVLPDSATDGHAAIIDPVRGIEYDFWQLRKERGRWVASAAALLDYTTSGVHEDRFSVAASGFPLAAGLIWPSELLSATPGAIDHALVFGYPLTRLDAFVAPATRSDGWMTDPDSLPMGAHIQLDPTFDIAASDLTEPEKRIAEALQTYGAYLYDTGSPGSIIELNAVNPRSFASDPYAALPGYDAAGGFLDVGNIPVDRFRVLELGPIAEWGVTYPTDIAFAEEYYGVE